MTITARLVLLLVAGILFILAGLNVGGPVRLEWIAFGLVTFALMIP